MGAYGMFVIFVPVYMFLILPAAMVLRGESRGFIGALGTLNLGLMLIVYALGHAAYLLVLPPDNASGAGLLLALVLLTEANDVAQYIAGRLFGRRQIAPTAVAQQDGRGFRRRHRRHDDAGRSAGAAADAAVAALVAGARPAAGDRGLHRRSHHVGDQARSWA